MERSPDWDCCVLTHSSHLCICRRPGRQAQAQALLTPDCTLDTSAYAADPGDRATQPMPGDTSSRGGTTMAPVPSAAGCEQQWSDKHAPARLEDLCVHKRKVAEVVAWLQEYLSMRSVRPTRTLLISGADNDGGSSSSSSSGCDCSGRAPLTPSPVHTSTRTRGTHSLVITGWLPG
jgi:Rad17 P-loop domain